MSGFEIDPTVTSTSDVEEYSPTEPGTSVYDGDDITLEAQVLRYLVDPQLEIYTDCRKVIFGSLTSQAFRNEAYVLFLVLQKFKEKFMVPDEEFLTIYLTHNLTDITSVNHKYVDINRYSDAVKEIDPSLVLGDMTDKALLFAGGVIKYYNDLLSLDAPDPDLKAVTLLVEKYKEVYSTSAAEEVLRKGLSILTTGYQEGSKVYAGFADSQDYIRRELSAIDGIVNEHDGLGYVSFEDMLNHSDDTRPVQQVGDFAEIDELNKHFHGLYTQQLITVAAPNKGGKTKLMCEWVYNAVTRFGQNVTMWPVEGSVNELMAEIGAIHFDRTFNAGKSVEHSMTGVTKQVILQDLWDSPSFGHPEWKKQYQAIMREFVANPNYGRIDFIDKPLVLETFTDDLDVSVDSNGSTLIAVDYLSLCDKSMNSRLAGHEIVSRLYKAASEYVKRKNVCMISPAQYTQEAIKDLARSVDSGRGVDMRASIAGSAEVLRSSDISFAMYGTTQDMLANRMNFLSLPSRTNQAFEPFTVLTNLGVSRFVSDRS